MHIKLSSILTWSIGSNAKAKYFTVKKQNEDDIHDALKEIVYSNQYRLVALFSTDVECIDNPKLSGLYHVLLYFNRNGETFFELNWNQVMQIIYLRKLQNKDYEKYRASIQSLFDAIVATKEFKQFARKATKNIQSCFKDVINPLYKGELRVSDDLDFGGGVVIKATEKDGREAINNLMKLKGKIVSSATLNLSHPELENM